MEFAVIVLVFCLTGFSSGSVVQVGEFTIVADNVPGLVSLTSPRSLVISGFSFSGNPPDTFVYSYAPGVALNASGGGTILPVEGSFATSEGGFKPSVAVENIDLRVDLPSSMTVCDIGTLTVWCREVGVIFSTLVIPSEAFESTSPCVLTGTRALLGDLNSTSPSVSGNVQATGPNTVRVRNFNFAGTTNSYFYTFPVGVNPGGSITGGTQLTNVDGATSGSAFSSASNVEVTIQLAGTGLCGVGTLAFGNPTDGVLTQVTLPNRTASLVSDSNCLLGVEFVGRVVVGLLPAGRNNIGGLVQFTSESSIFIKGLRYDGGLPGASLYYFAPGEAVNATVGGTVIELPATVSNQNTLMALEDDVYIPLPGGVTVCGIGAVAIISRSNGSVLSSLPVAPSVIDSSIANCSLNSGTIIAGYLDGLHDVRGFVRITSTTSFLLENFQYDGQPPDTFVYAYAPGVEVDPQGGGFLLPITGPLATSEGAFIRNQRVSVDNLLVQLPSGTDMCGIGHLSVWCRQVRVLFATIEMSRDLFVMNGQGICTLAVEPSGSPNGALAALENCVPLGGEMQASWTLDRINEQIDVRVCGCQGNPDTPQYVSFGLSGSDTQTFMDGADPVISWVDSSGQPRAVDYYLQPGRRYQCRSSEGVCPDVLYKNCTNDVFGVSGTVIGKLQCISYSRRLVTTDSVCDHPINPNITDQYIVWAIGGVGETAFKHFSRATLDEAPLNLGRSPRDQCTEQLTCQSCDPFQGKQMTANDDNTFMVQIGPSGNERGYMGITGRAGWGIAWYVNGVLIPELVVERGKTYTFMIFGGNNPADLSNYHPFYITSSISGGRSRNSAALQESEIVYAGFNSDDQAIAVGNLCEKKETLQAQEIRESCGSFEDYLKALTTPTCSSPGKLTWTPDEKTPDKVYYQCATHLNLGFAISVKDIASRTLPGVVTILISILVSYLLFSW